MSMADPTFNLPSTRFIVVDYSVSEQIYSRSTVGPTALHYRVLQWVYTETRLKEERCDGRSHGMNAWNSCTLPGAVR